MACAWGRAARREVHLHAVRLGTQGEVHRVVHLTHGAHAMFAHATFTFMFTGRGMSHHTKQGALRGARRGLPLS